MNCHHTGLSRRTNMQARDRASMDTAFRNAVSLDELCPKLRLRRWRQSLHKLTDQCCIYCGEPSESIDHVIPKSKGGPSVSENCVPACLTCNGRKGDHEVFTWYRLQSFYDPRRAVAIRAWTEGDLKLATHLLGWASQAGDHTDSAGSHQTRHAAGPLCLSQIAA